VSSRWQAIEDVVLLLVFMTCGNGLVLAVMILHDRFGNIGVLLCAVLLIVSILYRKILCFDLMIS